MKKRTEIRTSGVDDEFQYIYNLFIAADSDKPFMLFYILFTVALFFFFRYFSLIVRMNALQKISSDLKRHRQPRYDEDH